MPKPAKMVRALIVAPPGVAVSARRAASDIAARDSIQLNLRDDRAPIDADAPPAGQLRVRVVETASAGGSSLAALLAVGLVLGCQTDRATSLASRSEPAAGGSPHPLSVPDPASSGPTEPAEPRRPDVLYVPTPQDVVDAMLVLARVSKDDVVYDLGCGDGRIVVTAAERYGARAVGYDIDPERVREARQNVAAHHVEQLVSIEQRDIFTLDLSTASVVALYLLPELNVKLLPQLERMKPGSRIVSHDFDIRGVVPHQVLRLGADHKGVAHSIYFYELPLTKEP